MSGKANAILVNIAYMFCWAQNDEIFLLLTLYSTFLAALLPTEPRPPWKFLFLKFIVSYVSQGRCQVKTHSMKKGVAYI